MLGLAQLYQIRGRIGRSDAHAYAYLLYPSEELLTSDAAARLTTLSDHTELGAGFKIAMADLEIRGAGNLLGDEQSGHVAAVGFEMYAQMLEEAVHELQGEQALLAAPVRVDLPVTAYVPPEYIAYEASKIDAHRRIARAARPARARRRAGRARRPLRPAARAGRAPAHAAGHQAQGRRARRHVRRRTAAAACSSRASTSTTTGRRACAPPTSGSSTSSSGARSALIARTNAHPVSGGSSLCSMLYLTPVCLPTSPLLLGESVYEESHCWPRPCSPCSLPRSCSPAAARRRSRPAPSPRSATASSRRSSSTRSGSRPRPSTSRSRAHRVPARRARRSTTSSRPASSTIWCRTRSSPSRPPIWTSRSPTRRSGAHQADRPAGRRPEEARQAAQAAGRHAGAARGAAQGADAAGSKLQQKVISDVKVSDAKLKAYFDDPANKAQFQQAATVDARHVLVKTKAEADKVHALLSADRSDANWKKVAAKYSTDPGSKDKGGSLGSFPKGRMVPPFDKVAFSAQARHRLAAGQDAVRLARHRGHQKTHAGQEQDLRRGQEPDPADAALYSSSPRRGRTGSRRP